MNDERRAPSLADYILESPITWLFTAINLGVFAIVWNRGETEGTSLTVDTLRSFGAVYRPRVQAGEYWRLLTAVFLHTGWIHLLWNSWAMFGWCASIEKAVGSLWFAFAYVTTGVAASAVSVLSHTVTAAGASGAGFGMIAVILALLYRRAGGWDPFISSPAVKNILVNTGIWVLIGFSGFIRMDNYAHLGGFAFGVPCGLVLGFRRGQHRGRWIAGLAAYILVILALVVAACVPEFGFGD
jgi:rhomboid protease GluP